jgi:hypothetical protein
LCAASTTDTQIQLDERSRSPHRGGWYAVSLTYHKQYSILCEAGVKKIAANFKKSMATRHGDGETFDQPRL